MSASGVRGALSRLGRESLIYGLGLSLAQLGSFLLLPILTRSLSPAEYGVVSLALTTGSLLSTLSSAGIASALFRSYYDHDSPEGRGRVVLTSLVITTVFGGALVVFMAAVSPWAAKALFGSSGLAYLASVIAAESAIRAIQSVAQSVLRAEHRPQAFIGVSLMTFLGRFALTWAFVAYLELGLRGYAAGTIAGSIAGLLLALMLVKGRIGREFDRREARLLTEYGLPMMVANLAAAVLVGADRYFLRVWHGLETVAVYNVGYQLASAVTVFLVTPISMAWPTIMLPMKDSPELPRFLRLSLTLLAGLGGWAVVTLAFAGPLLVRIVAPPGYGPAALIVPLVAGANSMMLLQRVLASGAEVHRKASRYAMPFVVAASAVVVLDALLIPEFGMYGAAVATLVAYLLLPVFAHATGKRLLSVSYDRTRLAAIAVASAALCSTGIALGSRIESSWHAEIGLAMLGAAAFPAVLVLGRVLTREHLSLALRSMGIGPAGLGR